MTLEDLITYLCDECAEQTLTAMQIRRSVLLAYEMGMNAGIVQSREAIRSVVQEDIVGQINAREAASLEALRREALEDTP